MAGPPLQVKVMSYNLYWWHLFNIQHGAGGSAGHLIQAADHPKPFDFMGFQECEDVRRVLVDGGISAEYEAYQGPHSICMAYRKADWKVLAEGQSDVAEDQRIQYFGRRAAQWMRLLHKGTGKAVFFVNHHGPLPLNSGGACGGVATAHNILKMIAANGRAGDAIIVLGDFNQVPGSATGKEMSTKLMKVFSGVFMGGIDNIFTNVKPPYIETKNLGPGGSDHDAIEAILQLGPPAPAPPPTAAPPPPPAAKPVATPAAAAAAKPGAQTAEPKVLHKDRGSCHCFCDWATKPHGCVRDDDDGSCCWKQCCHGRVEEAPSREEGAKEKVAQNGENVHVLQ